MSANIDTITSRPERWCEIEHRICDHDLNLGDRRPFGSLSFLRLFLADFPYPFDQIDIERGIELVSFPFTLRFWMLNGQPVDEICTGPISAEFKLPAYDLYPKTLPHCTHETMRSLKPGDHVDCPTRPLDDALPLSASQSPPLLDYARGRVFLAPPGKWRYWTVSGNAATVTCDVTGILSLRILNTSIDLFPGN